MSSPPPPGYKAAFDFDGDGKSDVGRWRSNNPTGEWQTLKSSNFQTETVTLGNSSDLIAPADYDNDNKTDYAVFTPSSGVWTICQSSTNTNVN
jgi:hypothetical protein